MACAGTIPTLTGGASAVLSGNVATITVDVTGDTTSVNYTLGVYRKKGSSPTFLIGERVSSNALTFSAAPPTQEIKVYNDTIADHSEAGDFYYAVRVECEGSDFGGDALQCNAGAGFRVPYFPAANPITVSLNALEATVRVTVNGNNTSQGFTISLYAKWGSAPTFQPSEKISQQTVDTAVSGNKEYVYVYSIANGAIWYFQARIENAVGGGTAFTGADESSQYSIQPSQFSTGDPELTVSVSGNILTITPSVDLVSDVSNFWLRTRVKLGSAPTSVDPIVNAQVVPAGAAETGFPFTYAVTSPGVWYVKSWIETGAGVFTGGAETAVVLSSEVGHIVISGVTDGGTPTTHVTDIPVPPPTTVPHEGIDELIVLVKVKGSPSTRVEYYDDRILSQTYQRVEWWYHRTGGCGAFRLMMKQSDPVWQQAITEGWEIHCRIKLENEQLYKTWYRGVVKSMIDDHSGQEQMFDIRGFGYAEYLKRIYVQKKYSAGLTVRDVVVDILNTYVSPVSRIRLPDNAGVSDAAQLSAMTAGSGNATTLGPSNNPAYLQATTAVGTPTNYDPTRSGIDASGYVLQGDLHFETSAWEALKTLAELQGSREFGVDADGFFYWKATSSTVGHNFYGDKDIGIAREGAKLEHKLNQIKLEGAHLGCREHLTIRGDVTDIADRGLFEGPIELPWITHQGDATRWADNVIASRKARYDWRTVSWNGVSKRLCGTHPMNRVQYRGSGDATNFIGYDVCKIHYIKGGFPKRGEIKEVGETRANKTIDNPVIRAEFWLGPCVGDMMDELGVIVNQVEALKGKWKQFRYPRDITLSPVGTDGLIPGEIKHYSKDITNCDITNNQAEVQNSTYPRGNLVAFLNKQWTALGIRRVFQHSAPSRGLYYGEIIAVITDITNSAAAAYYWNGTSWVGAGGEVNTASNVGSGGVGPYDSKSLADLRFRNVNTTSDKIGVALDVTNKEIDITPHQSLYQNIFQGRIQLDSTTQISLQRYNGDYVEVNGEIVSIGSSGKDLLTGHKLIDNTGAHAAAGMVASTLYYVYLSNSSATDSPLRLRASTTAPSKVNGVYYLGTSGNALNWRFVGWVYTNASINFQDQEGTLGGTVAGNTLPRRWVVNYYNRIWKRMMLCPSYSDGGSATSYNASTTTDWLELNASGTANAHMSYINNGEDSPTFISHWEATNTGSAAFGIGYGASLSASIAAVKVATEKGSNETEMAACSYSPTPVVGVYYATMVVHHNSTTVNIWADGARDNADADTPLTFMTATVPC